MASFREVFSTTGKVLIALIVIAVGVAVIWGVINALSSQSSLSRPPAPNESFEDIWADSAPTRVPQSQWDRQVNAAIAAHCVFEGMTKDQAARAAGKPVDPTLSSWSFERQDKQTCLKYNGDACAEFMKYTAVIYFSKHENVKKVEGAESVFPKSLSSLCYAVSYLTAESAAKTVRKAVGIHRTEDIPSVKRSRDRPTQGTGKTGCPSLADGDIYEYAMGWQYCSGDGPCLTPEETKRCFK